MAYLRCCIFYVPLLRLQLGQLVLGAHNSAHTVQTSVVMCTVDVFPVQLGITFTASTADTSSTRTSQCMFGGFPTCGLTLLGLS